MLAACTGDQETDTGQNPPDQITYLTNFGAFGRDSHAYLADAQGIFAAANIDVKIELGTGTAGNLTELQAGNAQFVPVDFAGLALTRNEGTRGLVAIAAIQQRSLASVMTADPGITSPLDLAGKKVGLPTGAVTGQLFPVYASLAGVDLAEVEQVEMAGNELIGALASGQVHAIGQFIPGRGTVENVVGKPITVLPYDEVLVDQYGVVLVTTRDRAEEDPDLCVRFRDALLAGLEAAVANPEAAGEAIFEAEPDSAPADVAAEEMRVMEAYVRTSGRPLGEMDEARVVRALSELTGANALHVDTDPKDLVAFELPPGQDSE
ncbi:MAG TPA: ABC transporter substrate-binding protein [Propionibacteriaceae bacterium]|nr:ABC transporter substrate-binding protein [Propionibacteriaceae bacterium]